MASVESMDLAVERTPALRVVCRPFCKCRTMRGSDGWTRGGAVPGQAREEAARDLCDMLLGCHDSVIWLIPYTMERERHFLDVFKAGCDLSRRQPRIGRMTKSGPGNLPENTRLLPGEEPSS